MTKQTSKKLKVAIVGCGQIADAHLKELAKVSSAEVVAVCDSYRDLAYQAAARFEVKGIYDDLDLMIKECDLDVIHLTTPAHTHGFLAEKILKAGCHIYVEKPFTLDTAQAESVLDVAKQNNRLVCAGHDQLFDPMWLELKKRVEDGLIGEVQHVESLLIYPMTGLFGAQVTANPNHWVRKLPGGLFHNTISHPLYRITDLLDDPSPEILAHWQRRSEEMSFPTEMRLNLYSESVTGTLTFLSSAKPSQRITRVYGDAGALEVDFDSQIIRRNSSGSLPGAFQKLLDPYRQWREGARNLRSNIWRFMKSDIHYFAGMKNLFEEFYSAIRGEKPLPIQPEEIIRVTRLMDSIFEQCEAKYPSSVEKYETKMKSKKKIEVTS